MISVVELRDRDLQRDRVHRAAGDTIGVWATTERPKVPCERERARLGNPLVNEVIIPTTRKDEWNRGTPDREAKLESFYRTGICGWARPTRRGAITAC